MSSVPSHAAPESTPASTICDDAARSASKALHPAATGPATGLAATGPADDGTALATTPLDTEVLDDIAAGALVFESGADWGWSPPADDPGWQMHRDRDRYRALLGR